MKNASGEQMALKGQCAVIFDTGLRAAQVDVSFLQGLPLDAIIGTDALCPLEVLLHLRPHGGPMALTRNKRGSFVPLQAIYARPTALVQAVIPPGGDDVCKRANSAAAPSQPASVSVSGLGDLSPDQMLSLEARGRCLY